MDCNSVLRYSFSHSYVIILQSLYIQVSSVPLHSHIWIFVTPRTAACQASLISTPGAYSNSCPSSQWCHPSISFSVVCSLLLQPSIFLSIRVFSKVSVLRIRWPKCWSLSFGISPSNEYSELISCRIDWFYLLAVQGTLKSLLHIELWCSQFKSINSLVLSSLYSPKKVSTH